MIAPLLLPVLEQLSQETSHSLVKVQVPYRGGRGNMGVALCVCVLFIPD